MTFDWTVVVVPYDSRAHMAVMVRRELDRVERLLLHDEPEIIVTVGINLILRQLHLLHATVEESDRWLDLIIASMKEGMRNGQA